MSVSDMGVQKYSTHQGLLVPDGPRSPALPIARHTIQLHLCQLLSRLNGLGTVAAESHFAADVTRAIVSSLPPPFIPCDKRGGKAPETH